MRYRRFAARYTAVVTVHNFVPGAELLRPSTRSLAPAPRGWRPAADIREDERAITVTVDLAGVSDENVDIQLFEDALVIEGVRSPPGPGRGFYHAAEIRHGPFRLEVTLATRIDPDGVEARYDRGLLSVMLPKADAVPVARRTAAPTPGAAEPA